MNSILLRNTDTGLTVLGGCSITEYDCYITINHIVEDCFIRIDDCSIRVYQSFSPFLCLHCFSDVAIKIISIVQTKKKF